MLSFTIEMNISVQGDKISVLQLDQLQMRPALARQLPVVLLRQPRPLKLSHSATKRLTQAVKSTRS